MAFILTDLDGTLLQSDATVSAYTADVLNAAIAAGHRISYATARGYESASRVTKSIRWCEPVVLYNGAMLYDPSGDGRVLGGNWLDGETTRELLAEGERLGLSPFLFMLAEGDRVIVRHKRPSRPGELAFFESRPGDPRFREVERVTCDSGFRTLIATYIGLFSELEPFYERVKAGFGGRVHVHMMEDRYIKDHYFLEMSHYRANKSEGLRLWAQAVGCSDKDIAVFGDQVNDLGLFEAAGRCYAVGNAVQPLKELADAVIGTNDEHGVARKIAELCGLD